MFAGAAREVVFSNREVIRRVKADFIPVALKAAMVNNPPPGIEGRLYAEIARSRPAPQGICTANSAGKVLSWTLSFDDDASILGFLDHVCQRYQQHPDDTDAVTAQRYMRFPGHKLPDVADTDLELLIPSRHAPQDHCPGRPMPGKGTLVGRIIGRALDDEGRPLADTIRQEHYMESRFELPIAIQEAVAAAEQDADGAPFEIPDELARALMKQAYLGQLDVNPMGTVPGSRNDHSSWNFVAERIESDTSDSIRVSITGLSDARGGPDGLDRQSDGRMWEHRVSLHWQGYADIKQGRITRLVMLAEGDENLRWGNRRFQLTTEPAARHLMAGHPIDLSCGVRYSLIAQ